MFSGIIGGVGRIVDARPLGDAPGHGKRLVIEAPPGYLDDVGLGDSICLSGACMTAVRIDAPGTRFEVDISAESLDRTAGLDTTGAINLEKALRAHDRLDGHLVSGHVDGVGVVTRVDAAGESTRLDVRAPAVLAPFLAQKGSIAIDGVSLTVNSVEDDADGCTFGVNVIPHTLAHTTLGGLVVGRRVNLEIDLIARYVERMLGLRRQA